jgi:hypothetical protein
MGMRKIPAFELQSKSLRRTVIASTLPNFRECNKAVEQNSDIKRNTSSANFCSNLLEANSLKRREKANNAKEKEGVNKSTTELGQVAKMCKASFLQNDARNFAPQKLNLRESAGYKTSHSTFVSNCIPLAYRLIFTFFTSLQSLSHWLISTLSHLPFSLELYSIGLSANFHILHFASVIITLAN